MDVAPPEKRELIIGTAAIVVLSGGLLVSFSRSSCLMLMTGVVLLAWRAFGAAEPWRWAASRS